MLPAQSSPLDIILSCSICQQSISSLYEQQSDKKAHPDSLNATAKDIAKLWLTECAHLVCHKHLERSAVLASVNGPKLCAVCPRCRKSDDEKPKRFFAICGIARGDYDEEIPHEYFQMPPPGLEAGRQGLEALRFHYLSLLQNGSTMHDELQIAEAKLRCWESKRPEAHHEDSWASPLTEKVRERGLLDAADHLLDLRQDRSMVEGLLTRAQVDPSLLTTHDHSKGFAKAYNEVANREPRMTVTSLQPDCTTLACASANNLADMIQNLGTPIARTMQDTNSPRRPQPIRARGSWGRTRSKDSQRVANQYAQAFDLALMPPPSARMLRPQRRHQGLQNRLNQPLPHEFEVHMRRTYPISTDTARPPVFEPQVLMQPRNAEQIPAGKQTLYMSRLSDQRSYSRTALRDLNSSPPEYSELRGFMPKSSTYDNIWSHDQARPHLRRSDIIYSTRQSPVSLQNMTSGIRGPVSRGGQRLQSESLGPGFSPRYTQQHHEPQLKRPRLSAAPPESLGRNEMRSRSSRVLASQIHVNQREGITNHVRVTFPNICQTQYHIKNSDYRLMTPNKSPHFSSPFNHRFG